MSISNKALKKIALCIFVATFIGVATFCTAYIGIGAMEVFALDDETFFSRTDANWITPPSDIRFFDRGFERTDAQGRKIKYILRDKRARVYVDNKLVWKSDDDYYVQDMFVADIDTDANKNGDLRVNNNYPEEMVLLLWKEGRYGNHRPFWVDKDEREFSQHLFVYSIEDEKVRSRWGSSYMGDIAGSMDFKDGILFLSHNENEDNSESAWKWFSFGFEKIDPVTVFVAGDNLIHDVIYEDAIKNHNGDFSYIYEKVEKYTKKADLSIINLETPLVYDERNYSTYPCFGSPVSVARGIKDAGFDLVTLSTNHRFDKGKTGIEDTLKAVEENELMHVGSMDEKPYVLIKRGEITLALLNYTYGTNGIRPPKGYEKGVNYLDDEERIREEIREAKNNSDFVIVFPHWGTEYRVTPDSYEEKWRDVFYEEEVDAVVGTHPHVYQKVEMYQIEHNEHKMLVYYSLGNYISGNVRHEHNSGGVGIFKISVTRGGPVISSYDFEIIDTMYSQNKYKSK